LDLDLERLYPLRPESLSCRLCLPDLRALPDLHLDLHALPDHRTLQDHVLRDHLVLPDPLVLVYQGAQREPKPRSTGRTETTGETFGTQRVETLEIEIQERTDHVERGSIEIIERGRKSERPKRMTTQKSPKRERK